jgi:hypothetical protein
MPLPGVEPGLRPSGGRVPSVTRRGHERSRRPGSNRHEPAYKAGASPFGHVGGKQGRKESNPVREFWRLAALPGARPCKGPGRSAVTVTTARIAVRVSGGGRTRRLELHGLACCRYTTDTVTGLSKPPARAGAEGAGVEPARLIARPLSRRVPSPIGWPFRIVSSSGRCRGRTCGLQRVMLALWPAELTARLFQHPDQDSNPGLLVRSEA